MLQFVPIASCDTTEKSLALLFSSHSLQVFIDIDEISLIVLFSRLNSLGTLSLSSDK